MLGFRGSDQRLVAAVRAGDEQAFEQLHAYYRGMIFAFCRHLTGQREDAEDAVQHTFLAAYRQITESDRKINLRPWLFTVARNRCLTLRERRVRLQSQRVDEDLAVGDLAEEVQRREDLRQLVHDLHGLPEPQRAALLLSELESLSHRQVAQVLDVPDARVKALVYQARSSLAATREARDVACWDVRQQLATLSGSALRRRLLRRHVHECSGCSEFEAAIARQRRGLAALLPAAAARSGWRALLGRGAEGAATGVGGTGAGSTAAGGGALAGGVGGSLAGLGAPVALKLAAVVAVVGGGTMGVATGTVPAAVGDLVHTVGERTAARTVESHAQAPVLDGRPGSPRLVVGGPVPIVEARGDRAGTTVSGRRVPAVERRERPRAASSDASPGHGGSSAGGSQGQGGAPRGLAKHGGVPPGQAKDGGPPEHAGGNGTPPGLAKRGGAVPGQGKVAPPGQVRKDREATPTGSRPAVPPGQAKGGPGAPGERPPDGGSGSGSADGGGDETGFGSSNGSGSTNGVGDGSANANAGGRGAGGSLPGRGAQGRSPK